MRGRPPKNRTQELSKGFYKPPDLLEVNKKDPRYVYRWISAKKLESDGADYRGWEVIRRGQEADESIAKTPFNVKSLDSTKRQGDLVLARMPVEQAEARNRYFREKNQLRMEMVKLRQQGRRDNVEMEIKADVRKGGVVEVREG